MLVSRGWNIYSLRTWRSQRWARLPSCRSWRLPGRSGGSIDLYMSSVPRLWNEPELGGWKPGKVCRRLVWLRTTGEDNWVGTSRIQKINAEAVSNHERVCVCTHECPSHWNTCLLILHFPTTINEVYSTWPRQSLTSCFGRQRSSAGQHTHLWLGPACLCYCNKVRSPNIVHERLPSDLVFMASVILNKLNVSSISHSPFGFDHAEKRGNRTSRASSLSSFSSKPWNNWMNLLTLMGSLTGINTIRTKSWGLHIRAVGCWYANYQNKKALTKSYLHKYIWW